ncbi:transcriptional regulator, TetR family [Poseidonocella pacifica]|uniref:Transcriptional regulator, TetR family n=1 Tax=Poseidonocella pacifica TaxID=871651 RepID=A0A1I0XCH7_9RHOB|nr:TetR/AcrR family transcriptional regulator [Poseidonocella pacifica]SFA98397.1 transcriptional regulator, TetR family [Poseidonocella pacifica]
MGEQRKPRADALKNRARLIDAARVILGNGGPGASLEAVARAAEVGIGTLYRHFPTREALFEAVYQHEVEQLIALAEELGTAEDPVDALRQWLHALVGLVSTKRGLLGTLAVSHSDAAQALFDVLRTRLAAAVGALIARAVAEGRVRPDVDAEDLLGSVYALCNARPPGEGWKDGTLRLIDIFLDGMALS